MGQIFEGCQDSIYLNLFCLVPFEDGVSTRGRIYSNVTFSQNYQDLSDIAY